MEIVGGLEPLLGIGVEAAQVAAPEFGGAGIAQHCHQRGVGVAHDTQTVATADAVRGIHEQRAEVTLGLAEVILGSAEGGVEPADEQGHGEEQRKVNDCVAIFAGSQSTGERVVGADGKSKGGGGEAGLPTSVPGADHHRDGENDQAALGDVGEIQGRDQRQQSAEKGDAVSQDGSAWRKESRAAGEGKSHSYGPMRTRQPRAANCKTARRFPGGIVPCGTAAGATGKTL